MVAAQTMREYETIYVMNPEVTDPSAKDFMLKMKELVEREGGKSIKVDCLGRKKLAWTRGKHLRGLYVHHTYLGQPGLVHEYERALAIDESVILRQSKLVQTEVDPEARAVEADQLDAPVVQERKPSYGRGGYGDDMYDDFGDHDRFGDRDFDEGLEV